MTSKLSSILEKRLQDSGQKNSKVKDLANQAAEGNLSGFRGIFRIVPLSAKEEMLLNALLKKYAIESTEDTREEDCKKLSQLSSELKAIHNQAAFLHGERIKQAQILLKNYKEGAFSAWLVAVYGNRQTPYNFLYYYEFYHALSPPLQKKLELLPRQAAYTLASRQGEKEKKEKIVEQYQGEKKAEILKKIREYFPLKEKDKRASKEKLAIAPLISQLKNLQQTLSSQENRLLKELYSLIEEHIY